MDVSPFARALHRIPAIVVGSLSDGETRYSGLGTVSDAPRPQDLRWEIGSITKVFTGVLLTEMSLRGEVGLDDPIGLHLPPDAAEHLPPTDHQPTLTHLATHTAGLPRVPRAWLKEIGSDPDPYSKLTEQDVWDVLGPSTRRPNRLRSRYSNYGMGLLGHILGRVAGQPYGTLVRERILTPLEMAETGIGGDDPVPGFRKGKPTPPWTFGALEAAGGLRSTASDMLRFAAVCIDPPDTVLGQALDLARTPAHRTRVSGMGLGWQLRIVPPARPQGIVWHNGGTYGGASFLAVDVARRIALVSFGNRGPRLISPLDGAAWKVFDGLA